MPRMTHRAAQLLHAPANIEDNPMAWARSYQRSVLAAFLLEKRDRFVCVWHRKTGKDYLWANIAKLWMLQRIKAGLSGLVCHIFPTFKVGREIVWLGPCDKGQFLDSIFPASLVQDRSDSECYLRLIDGYGTKNGPVYQIVGAGETMQNRRGPNATGTIMSEHQDQPESCYAEIFEPMVTSNRGWSAFIGTPRGKNHFYRLFQYAQAEAKKPSSRWFAELLTRHDTRRDAPGEDGEAVMPQQEIDGLLARGEDPATIAQEYECSFTGVARGAIFAAWMSRALADGRITRVPREPQLPVGVALDIGRTDGTAAWFYQTAAREIRFINYLAFKADKVDAMSAAEYACKRIQSLPYLVGRVILPWDAEVKGYSARYSTAEIFRRWNWEVVVLDKVGVEQGIQMVASGATRFVFDADLCDRPQEDGLPSGLESLRGYSRSFRRETDDYSGDPVHNEFSHGADALRYGAMEGFTRVEFPGTRLQAQTITVDSSFDPRAPLLAGGMR